MNRTGDPLKRQLINVALVLLALAFVGGPATAQPPPKASQDIFIVAGLTLDANGDPVVPIAAPPSTLLFYKRTGRPILAPDGHQLTAGEFAAVEGTADIKCLYYPGTQVNIHLSGLVPGGIYRIWVLTFDEPGFDLTAPDPFEHLTGEGALGPNDRSRNTLRASASGEGTIVRFVPEGVFSEFGAADQCLLSDSFEFHLVGALQQPLQPYGSDVGPPAFFPETAVEQFVFLFRQH